MPIVFIIFFIQLGICNPYHYLFLKFYHLFQEWGTNSVKQFQCKFILM